MLVGLHRWVDPQVRVKDDFRLVPDDSAGSGIRLRLDGECAVTLSCWRIGIGGQEAIWMVLAGIRVDAAECDEQLTVCAIQATVSSFSSF